MKRTLLKTICSSALAVSLLASASLPAFADTTNTSTAPYVESDTTVNFTLESNKTYAYKLTVHGSHSNPKIAAGNGKVLRTESTVHKVENGNDVYYFKVRAIGKNGEATGVYTTLPGQNAVRHSDIAIPYSAGTYEVGKDIPAGQYVFSTNYYGSLEIFTNKQKWSNLSEPPMSLTDFHHGRIYENLENGRFISFRNAVAVLFKDSGKLLPVKDKKMQSDMYKIGFDINCGKYRISSGYDESTRVNYLICKDKNGSPSYDSADIIEQGSFRGHKDVNITKGDYLVIPFGDDYIEKE